MLDGRRCVIAGLVLLTGCSGSGSGGEGGDGTDGGPVVDGGSRRDAGPGDGVLRDGPVCTARGWCWETPLPAGGQITGLGATAEGQVVAGSSTHLFHVDGTTIRHAEPPTLTPYLNRIPVWGSAPDDVWANGFGAAIHFDGSRWSTASDVPFAASFTGVARDDVWAVGFGRIHHYDGAWSTLDTSAYEMASFVDAWALGPNEAIIVGLEEMAGLALHAKGTELTEIELPEGARPVQVYASSADDIWIAGRRLYRRADGSWSEMSSTSVGAQDIWGSGPDDVWFALQTSVQHWDGESMHTFELDGARRLTAISGTSATDVWAADTDGALHHYDGSAWSALKAPLAPTDLLSVAASDDGEAWAVGGAEVARRDADDGSWSLVPSPTTSLLTGIASAGGETFLFAGGGSYRRAGGDWELVVGGAGLRDACALADRTTLAVGNGLARYTGGEWVRDTGTVVEHELGLIDCFDDEAWATATQTAGRDERGLLLHYRDGQWARVGLTSIDGLSVRATRATGPDDGWVVASTGGDEAVVMRFDGAEWRQVQAPAAVRGVGGSSPDDMWLVGTGGLVRTWDGSSLADVDAPDGPDFEWVGSSGDGTARAVAAGGEVWQYDPAASPAWREVGGSLAGTTAVSSDRLVDVAFAGEEVFAAGNRSEPLQLTDGAWEPIGSFSATQVGANVDAGAWFRDSLGRVGHYDGIEITEPDPGMRSASELVVPARGSAVFVITRSGVMRLAGSSFVSERDTESRELTLFGASEASLWLVEHEDIRNDHTLVQRRVDGEWSTFPELGAAVALAAGPEGRLLALGSSLGMWRREDGAFRQLVAGKEGFEGRGTAGHVFDVDDAWALALGGLLHFDGASWTDLAEPVGLGFMALEAAPDGTLYAVGRGASIVRRAP